MAKRTRIQDFTEDDLKSICSVVKNITMQNPFSQDDYDDVRQELCLGLFKESSKFRSSKSDWKTFRWNVLAQIAGRIRRERMQPSNRYMASPTISLNIPAPSDGYSPDDHPTLMDLVTNDHTIADGTEPDGTDQLGLIVDVRMFINTLPPKYQRTCNAICEYGLTDAFKYLRITQKTFFRHVTEIRKLMVAAGLDAYLKK